MYIPKNIHASDSLDYKISLTLLTQNSFYELYLNVHKTRIVYLENYNGQKLHIQKTCAYTPFYTDNSFMDTDL